MKQFIIMMCMICIIFNEITGCSILNEQPNGSGSIADSKQYTAQELEALFWENEQELTEVADIILGSETFAEAFSENMKEDGKESVYTMTDAQYFSKEEWTKLQGFTEKLVFRV